MLLYLVLLFVGNNLDRNFILKDQVDVIELNHYHDSTGKHVFDQFIFRNWSRQNKRHDILYFHVNKNNDVIRRIGDKKYVVNFLDSQERFRVVYSNSYVETWTGYDPELKERNLLPYEDRKGLTLPEQ